MFGSLATMTAAQADQCDMLGLDLSQRTNAVVERKVNVLTVKHPWVGSAGVSYCATAKPGFDATIDTAYPQGTFFDFIGAAGSIVVKARPQKLRDAAVKCTRLALKDPDGLHHLDSLGLELTCNAKSGANGFVTVLITRKTAS
ncbi:hypothetical protein OCA5_c24460 [Afipia carboxidovorans OM5]|uniref:Uncharacterized protein n=2 Tax=Afipia carboxidovorans TaxID=40137 RepID=F8C0R6_AFIC5|nr:hypothetical protein OCA4_c24450 [Afipia carboxidovorans OM4]AEI07142.1 hypothetical protein OCA5_c24460 [Afipia carboxidovorans OM5]